MNCDYLRKKIKFIVQTVLNNHVQFNSYSVCLCVAWFIYWLISLFIGSLLRWLAKLNGGLVGCLIFCSVHYSKIPPIPIAIRLLPSSALVGTCRSLLCHQAFFSFARRVSLSLYSFFVVDWSGDTQLSLCHFHSQSCSFSLPFGTLEQNTE